MWCKTKFASVALLLVKFTSQTRTSSVKMRCNFQTKIKRSIRHLLIRRIDLKENCCCLFQVIRMLDIGHHTIVTFSETKLGDLISWQQLIYSETGKTKKHFILLDQHIVAGLPD